MIKKILGKIRLYKRRYSWIAWIARNFYESKNLYIWRHAFSLLLILTLVSVVLISIPGTGYLKEKINIDIDFVMQFSSLAVGLLAGIISIVFTVFIFITERSQNFVGFLGIKYLIRKSPLNFLTQIYLFNILIFILSVFLSTIGYFEFKFLRFFLLGIGTLIFSLFILIPKIYQTTLSLNDPKLILDFVDSCDEIERREFLINLVINDNLKFITAYFDRKLKFLVDSIKRYEKVVKTGDKKKIQIQHMEEGLDSDCDNFANWVRFVGFKSVEQNRRHLYNICLNYSLRIPSYLHKYGHKISIGGRSRYSKQIQKLFIAGIKKEYFHDLLADKFIHNWYEDFSEGYNDGYARVRTGIATQTLDVLYSFNEKDDTDISKDISFFPNLVFNIGEEIFKTKNIKLINEVLGYYNYTIDQIINGFYGGGTIEVKENIKNYYVSTCTNKIDQLFDILYKNEGFDLKSPKYNLHLNKSYTTDWCKSFFRNILLIVKNTDSELIDSINSNSSNFKHLLNNLLNKSKDEEFFEGLAIIGLDYLEEIIKLLKEKKRKAEIDYFFPSNSVKVKMSLRVLEKYNKIKSQMANNDYGLDPVTNTKTVRNLE